MGARGRRGRGASDKSDTALDASQLRPSIHPTYARLLLAELKRRGFTESDVVEGTRVDLEHILEADRFLSFEQFRRLALRGAELTGEGWLGLDVGRSTQVSSHGPLGYAMVASANVAEALGVAERFAALRLQIVRFEIERGGGRVRLRIEDTIGWGDIDEYIALHIVGAVTLLLETVSGMALPDTRVAFRHEEPPWVSEYATRLRGMSLEFGASVGLIDLPESFTTTPCITAAPSAFREATRLCERAESQHQSDEDTAQRVLDRLLDAHGSYPTLTEMAKTLHLSDRTLNRKLKAQGTSYQVLLDEVRQELAVWYLQHTDMTIEAVAEQLGYRDTSNFSRTCKRWFGLTPRALREG